MHTSDRLHSSYLTFRVIFNWTPGPRPSSSIYGGLVKDFAQLIHACSKDTEVTKNFTYLGTIVQYRRLSYQKVNRLFIFGVS